MYQVYAMASEDMDSLTFATPRLVRNMMTPVTAKLPIYEYEYDKVRLRSARQLKLPRLSACYIVCCWLCKLSSDIDVQAIF